MARRREKDAAVDENFDDRWAGETNALGGKSGLWTPVFGGTFPLISRTPKQIHAKSISTNPHGSTATFQHNLTSLLAVWIEYLLIETGKG
jgi:hypothetical protein